MAKEKNKLENTNMLDALNSIGNTPMLESELYTLLRKKDMRNASKIVNLVLKRANKKDDAKNYDLKECGIFIDAIRDRVLGFTDDNGDVKTTEKIKAMKYPNLYEAEEFVYAVVNESDKTEKTFKLMESISGIKLKDLTEWEKELLLHSLFIYCEDPIKSSLGLN